MIGIEYKTEQIVYVDIMFVNQVPYLESVVQPIEFLYVSKVANREHESIWNSLKTSLASKTKFRFRVKMIRVDGEGAINTEWFHNKANTFTNVPANSHANSGANTFTNVPANSGANCESDCGVKLATCWLRKRKGKTGWWKWSRKTCLLTTIK